MIQFQSDKKNINASTEALFTFLNNANNYVQLLPDNLDNFKTTDDTCSFSISKFGTFELKITESIPNSRIKIEPIGKAPIQFFIEWKIEEDQTNSIVNLYMEADVNPFIKMMAQKPLEDLMKYQIKKLTEIFNT